MAAAPKEIPSARKSLSVWAPESFPNPRMMSWKSNQDSGSFDPLKIQELVSEHLITEPNLPASPHSVSHQLLGGNFEF